MIGAGELCGAMFETPQGTGLCEKFGEHDRHGGVVTVGVFRCRRCRRPRTGGEWPDRACRCPALPEPQEDR